MDEASEELILRITLISISESFEVVEALTKSKISAQGLWRRSKEFTHGRHVPHNAIHKVLMAHSQAKINPNKIKAQEAMGSVGTDHSLSLVHLDWHAPPASATAKRFASSSMTVRGAFLQVENSIQRQRKQHQTPPGGFG